MQFAVTEKNELYLRVLMSLKILKNDEILNFSKKMIMSSLPPDPKRFFFPLKIGSDKVQDK